MPRKFLLSRVMATRELLLRKALHLTAEQLPADCQFGSTTERWVSDFQQKSQLNVDGVAGAATIKALEASTGETLIPS